MVLPDDRLGARVTALGAGLSGVWARVSPSGFRAAPGRTSESREFLSEGSIVTTNSKVLPQPGQVTCRFLLSGSTRTSAPQRQETFRNVRGASSRMENIL